MLAYRVRICGASRTDAGVHAYGQVFHADLPREYPLKQLQLGLQGRLRDYPIAIKEVRAVSADFHSQHARYKTYEYTVICRKYPSPLYRGWIVPRSLDASLIRNALPLLTGTHNFCNFRSLECTRNPIRTIHDISLTEVDDRLIFLVTGNSFLMHQIRFMIGALVSVGCGRLSSVHILQMLTAHNNRQAPRFTVAPAAGLVLREVMY